MSLARELEDLIGEYLGEHQTIGDLREWLYDHVQAVLDSSDPRLDELDGELWLLISEYDRRDRDEASIREHLGRLVPEAIPPHPAVSPRL
jgi:hypothetical protein